MISTITILMYLTKLKSKSQECQNDHQGVLSQDSLVSRDIDGVFECHGELCHQKRLPTLFTSQKMVPQSDVI
jgi:hypothetical protein